MDEGTRFLILSLEGDGYAIPVSRLVEITVPSNLQKDPDLSDAFEGRFEFRGRSIPVLNIKKSLRLSGKPGKTLLVVKSGAGMLGILADAVTEIVEADPRQGIVSIPAGVVETGTRCYRGVLRNKDKLLLLLNEDGLVP
jgi:purine-binding chemotaxis protein CheW